MIVISATVWVRFCPHKLLESEMDLLDRLPQAAAIGSTRRTK
jgi:hypothetical protein